MEIGHENHNWWLTDKYVSSVVELKFRGQALMFFPVGVGNLLHRPYPQSFDGTYKFWRKFIEDVQKEAPAQYKDHDLFRTFGEFPGAYIRKSLTYCMKITRHQEIVPFAHFAVDSEEGSNETGNVFARSERAKLLRRAWRPRKVRDQVARHKRRSWTS